MSLVFAIKGEAKKNKPTARIVATESLFKRRGEGITMFHFSPEFQAGFVSLIPSAELVSLLAEPPEERE